VFNAILSSRKELVNGCFYGPRLVLCGSFSLHRDISLQGEQINVCIYGFTTRTPELDECIAFAQEKAARLASRPSDWSSWQSRDMTTDPKQYGGAIRVNRLILSFSGFKEEQDEAAMLVLALNTELIDRGIAARFVEMSNNEYFRKLQDACGKVPRNPLDRYQFADEKHP
jgi:hypothetical protein